MSIPAIEVSGLSKRYVIKHEAQHDNLRDTLHHAARATWRRLRWGTGFKTEDFWAVRDVTFSVQPGEVLGVIGRNGAGKSTLLKLLSRITEPTQGRISLNGRVASLLEVGTGFHPDLTGRENIFLNGAILGMRRSEIIRKFDEIVEFAEVERFLDTPVKRYSSGMYVRLAFAVAAHLEPEILIVDEVLAVGDSAFQKKCLGKMQEVSTGAGRTVIFVSHQLGSVRRLCSRCLLMGNGRLVQSGPTADVLAAYENTAEVVQGEIQIAREIYPGCRILSMAIEISPELEHGSTYHRLTVVINGKSTGESLKYGFSLNINSGDGINICRIGPRLLGISTPNEVGSWRANIEVPTINRYIAGGRYELYIGLHEAVGSHLDITPQPLAIEIPEAAPYANGLIFSRGIHGLVPLPTVANIGER